MPTLRLDLDAATFERLTAVAIAELRPIPWQAEVLLRKALGMPFPLPGQPHMPEGGNRDGGPNGHQQ